MVVYRASRAVRAYFDTGETLMPFLYGILETLLLELFSFNFQIGATDVGADTHIKTGPLLIDRHDAYYQYTHRKKISIPLFFIT
jgi:hypothetical protein